MDHPNRNLNEYQSKPSTLSLREPDITCQYRHRGKGREVINNLDINNKFDTLIVQNIISNMRKKEEKLDS